MSVVLEIMHAHLDVQSKFFIVVTSAAVIELSIVMFYITRRLTITLLLPAV